MPDAGINHPFKLFIRPDDRMVAHGFILPVRRFVGISQYPHIRTGAFIKFIPFIRYFKSVRQVFSNRVLMILFVTDNKPVDSTRINTRKELLPLIFFIFYLRATKIRKPRQDTTRQTGKNEKPQTS